MMIHGWQIIGCDFARPHVLAESQLEKDGTILTRPRSDFSALDTAAKRLTFQARARFHHLQETLCFLPTHWPLITSLCSPHYSIIPEDWGMYSSRIHVKHTPHNTSIGSTQSLDSTRQPLWHYPMPHKDLVLVSSFRLCGSIGPGEFSVQYVCQFRKVWALIYL